MKIYSPYNARVLPTGQEFVKESLTDQLADEPLKRIFESYLAGGNVPKMSDGEIDASASIEDLDAALADPALDDVSQLDRVEQLDVLATAERLVEQLQQAQKAALRDKSLKTDLVEPKQKESTKDSIIESKVAENA